MAEAAEFVFQVVQRQELPKGQERSTSTLTTATQDVEVIVSESPTRPEGARPERD